MQIAVATMALVSSFVVTIPPPPGSARAVTFRALDHTLIYGDLYATIDKRRPFVLLFHQEDSNSGEYRTLAPRLVALGFNALAIDQRSGGGMWGRKNLTVAGLGRSSSPQAALADLRAARAWVTEQGYAGKTVVWGSGYSADLVFLLAADRSAHIAGVIACSPGTSLRDQRVVRKSAARVDVPVLILTSQVQAKSALAILDAMAGKRKGLRIPPGTVRGSSMLVEEKNPEAAWIWPWVAGFLEPYRDVPDADCKTVKERFAALQKAGTGRCRVAADCGCYNPVSPGMGCGGVIDAPTSAWLSAVEARFHAFRCRWPLQCAGWLCSPSCVAGHCVR